MAGLVQGPGTGIGYSSSQVDKIIQSHNEKLAEITSHENEIKKVMGEIRSVWYNTSSPESLSGRDKDFETIVNNIEIIKKNIATIDDVIIKQSGIFNQISYK